MVGLPKSIIKKYGISKKAWSVFRGKKRSSKPSRSSNPKGGIRKMARRFRRRRSRSSMTLPLGLIGGLAAGALMPNRTYIYGTVQYLKDGAFDLAIGNVVENFTGYSMWDGRWDFGALSKGLTPLVIGALTHKFVGGRPFNVNAMLGRAKVPYIRV